MSSRDHSTAAEPSFPGIWEVVHAVQPNGKPGYTGTITIERHGDAFALSWDISAGRYVGVGLRAGEHLLVGCGAQPAGLGVAVLDRAKDGSVAVRWCTPELQGSPGDGRLDMAIAGSFVGEHRLEQRLPDGSPHGEWTLGVTPSGEVFDVAWRKGATVHFRGLGLATTEGLVVGWYPDLEELAILDYFFDQEDPDLLIASWALGGHSPLGSERLRRR